MYDIVDLKPGRAVTLDDGAPYLVLSSQFSRKSQSKANMQCKLKNLKTGAIISRNFQGSEKIDPAEIGYRHCQYLYENNNLFTFMDLQTYDQFTLSRDVIGDHGQYLTEGMELDALVFDENPIGINLPPTVDLEVVETSPGIRGNTAQGGTKPAKLKSGVTVNVPLFINEGDSVRVNTETGAYKERVT
jgi:elongation factor P